MPIVGGRLEHVDEIHPLVLSSIDPGLLVLALWLVLRLGNGHLGRLPLLVVVLVVILLTGSLTRGGAFPFQLFRLCLRVSLVFSRLALSEVIHEK